MDPLGSTAGRLEGPAPLGAEETFGLDAEGAGPTQPVPPGHLQDAVTRLQDPDRKASLELCRLLVLVATKTGLNRQITACQRLEHTQPGDFLR